jgi:predicted cation transporter
MSGMLDMGYVSIGALAVIMALVLLLPFSVKKVEEELEAFLLVMGLIAVTASNRWSLHLIGEAVFQPVPITLAVLLAGFLFRLARPHIRRSVDDIVWLFGPRPAMAGIVFLLGLASGLITSIVAALFLSEAASALKLGRARRVRFVVYACYAIGLGSALTPLGGPVSAVVITALKGPPHFADFFFLARLLLWWVLPGIALVSALAALPPGAEPEPPSALAEDPRDSGSDIFLRAGKIYIFVMALVCLGAGLRPLAEHALPGASDRAVFWLNSVSAVLDNATMAAAEIIPALGVRTILCALLGMLISGGMLIPGNIPNIVCAAKLGIRSREWAAAAVPLGLALMAGYFVLLLAFGSGLVGPVESYISYP